MLCGAFYVAATIHHQLSDILKLASDRQNKADCNMTQEQDRQCAFITGANRGIGLALVKVYLADDYRVFAGTRRPQQAADLLALRETMEDPERLLIVELDVAREVSIIRAARDVGRHTHKLDVLLHNAGIFAEGEEGLETVDTLKMLNVFNVNCVAPVVMTAHFLNLLKAAAPGAKIGSLVSGAGVLKDRRSARSQYSYGASKAALNMVIKNMAGDLEEHGIISIGLAPGFVKTDMTAGAAKEPPLTPDQSARGLKAVMDKVTLENTGHFFAHEGHRCEWEMG